MNKVAHFILKVVGAFLAVAAVACVLIGFWDEIVAGGRKIMMKVRKKLCPEYDYYDEDDEEQRYFAE